VIELVRKQGIEIIIEVETEIIITGHIPMHFKVMAKRLAANDIICI
jgi:hypothetical protein